MDTSGEEIERYLEENCIRIYPTNILTTRIRGFCYYDLEEYHVLTNNKMDFRGQRKTTLHELIHIFEDHFSCPQEDRDKCEQEVHSIIEKLRSFDSDNDFEFVW